MEQIVQIIDKLRYCSEDQIPLHVVMLLLCTAISGSLVWLVYRLYKVAGGRKDTVKQQYVLFRVLLGAFTIPVLYLVTLAMHTDFHGGWTGEYLNSLTCDMRLVFWLLLVVWAVGFLVKGVQLLEAFGKLRKIRIMQQECRAEERKMLERVCREMGICKRMGLYKGGMIQNPCISGVVHPCIYMGNGVYTDEEEYMILQHELTHYQHRDVLFRVLVEFLGVIYWFHPLFFSGYMKRENAQLGEDFCDYMMCQHVRQESYIYTLLKIALHVQDAPVLPGVAAAENMSEVRRRIEKMEENKKRHPMKKRAAMLGAIGFMMACTVSVSAAGVGVVQGYETIHAWTDTGVNIEHPADYIPEYTIYTEEAVFDSDLTIEDVTDGEVMSKAGSQLIEKTVNAKTVSKLVTITAASTKIKINFDIEPTNKIVEVGLIDTEKGTKDSIRAKHIAATTFTVKKGRKYQLYVSNTNHVAVDITGHYTNK